MLFCYSSEKQFYVSFCLIFICIFSAFSQPPNVNLSTGQLSFSKTLMTAKGQTVSLPIALSYNSHVTKIQRASWAGLGFSLDVPYIEREIVGPPDDRWGNSTDYSKDVPASQLDNLQIAGVSIGPSINKHFMYMTYKPLIYKVITNNLSINNGIFYKLTMAEKKDPNIKCYTIDAAGVITLTGGLNGNDNYFDCQSMQDVYQLHNFPAGDRRLFFSQECANSIPGGASATNPNGDSLFVGVAPYAPWKVSYHIPNPSGGVGSYMASIDRWTIVDENGTEYVFDKAINCQPTNKLYENASIVYDKVNTDPWQQRYSMLQKHFTSWTTIRWYLTKINSYSGEQLKIEYTDVGRPATLTETPYFNNITTFEQELPPPPTTQTVSTVPVDEQTIKNALQISEIPKAKVKFDIRINNVVMNRNMKRIRAFTWGRIKQVCDRYGNFLRASDRAYYPGKTIWLLDDDQADGFVYGLGIDRVDLDANPWAMLVIHVTTADGTELSLPYKTTYTINGSSCDFLKVTPEDRNGIEGFNPADVNFRFNPNYYDPCVSGTPLPENELPTSDNVCQMYGCKCKFAQTYLTDDFNHPGEGDNLAWGSGGWSTLEFKKELEFKTPVRVKSVDIILSASNRCYNMLQIAKTFPVSFDYGHVALGDRLTLSSSTTMGFNESSSAWSSDMMMCGPQETGLFPLDYLDEQDICYYQREMSLQPSLSTYWTGTIPDISAYTDCIEDVLFDEDHPSATIVDHYCQTVYGTAPVQIKRYYSYNVQAVDNSMIILNPAYPSKILTGFQRIDFGVSPTRSDEDEFGRPALQSLTVTDSTSHEVLQKVLFSYAARTGGKLQLSDIYEQRTSDVVGTRKIAHFTYATTAVAPDDKYFASMNTGIITQIDDENGGTVSYSYEPGSYRYLSNGTDVGSAHTACFRVRQVMQGGLAVVKPIVTNISYQDGELNYTGALPGTLYESNGVSYPDFDQYHIQLPQCLPHYGTVTVSTQGRVYLCFCKFFLS
jgi:hypothetical protein